MTCHMPGQVVAYPIVDLRSVRSSSAGAAGHMGARAYVHALEDAVTAACAQFGRPFDNVRAGREPGREGCWVHGTNRKVGGRVSLLCSSLEGLHPRHSEHGGEGGEHMTGGNSSNLGESHRDPPRTTTTTTTVARNRSQVWAFAFPPASPVTAWR